MQKRHKLNVLIGGIIVKKLVDSRGVDVIVAFKTKDLINPETFMIKRYEITNLVWYNRLVEDFKTIGIPINQSTNLKEQLQKGVGKYVNITYLDKGNGYSTIFFESEGVDDEYKSMSVDDVLQSVLAKEPLHSDDDFMDDNEPISKEELYENINY